MHKIQMTRHGLAASVLAVTAMFTMQSANAQLNSGGPQILSTGQRITPLAAYGSRFEQLNPNLADNPEYTVGQAVTTALSPDGKTLLILTSGFNVVNYADGAKAGQPNVADSTEFVFIYDVTSGEAVRKQVIQVANTYSGMAFNPNGQQFYVSGGKDDVVHVYGLTAGTWAEAQMPVALGHLALANPARGNFGGLGLITPPMAAGLAVSQDGNTIVVCNYENDSISILSASSSGWAKSGELDLRPGKIDPTKTGRPGGTYPYWVSIVGNSTAYVSSIRDREIDVVNIAGTPGLITRIGLPGSPNRSVLSADQKTLFVAQDNADMVAAINTATNTKLGEIRITAPPAVFPNLEGYKGANPNSLALSPDGKKLFVTNGGENAVAVVTLASPVYTSTVQGLIPTGFYPNSVSVAADGKHLFIVNGKSATGPNPENCQSDAVAEAGTGQNCSAANQYTFQLTKAGFQTVPMPNNYGLAKLTQTVIQNDHFLRQLTTDHQYTMSELHNKIQHVIYIIKENRTYDQVLGDLPVGNGDPDLTQFPWSMTPNLHSLAMNFVDFDNFSDVSNVSGDGWPWSTSARTTDTIEKEIPVNYAGRGGDNNSEGTNRNVNVAIANPIARITADPLIGTDPDLLAGNRNVAAPDSAAGGQGEGYIWNAVHSAGLSVRDYGFFVDIARYNLPAAFGPLAIPEDPTPYKDHLQVGYSTNPFLSGYTDPYFRGFDNSFPDYFRFQEWDREFKQFDAQGQLPALSLVRLMHDHFGNFSTAINGVNLPDLQVADNDYAVGLVVDAVAHSKHFSGNTLIFVIEDDAQDGADHVDAHRSTAFIVGPYVKQGYVDSNSYNTVNMLRTIEDILGTPHLNLNDASALPMVDAFDLTQSNWNYNAAPSTLLMQTTLPIPASAFNRQAAAVNEYKPLHDAKWWAANTEGMDFSVEDHLDTAKFNRVLWTGTMGNKPYPTYRSGLDLRANRTELLKRFQQTQSTQTTQTEQKVAATTGSGAGQ